MARRIPLAVLTVLLASTAAFAQLTPEDEFEWRLRGFVPVRPEKPRNPILHFESEAAPAPAAAVVPSPFTGLKLGARDSAQNGPVRRLQKALFGRWLTKMNYRADWAAYIERDEPGHYGDGTMKAVTLLKVIYGTGRDGGSIDDATGRLVVAIETGAFWKDGLAPKKSAGGEALYRAARFLGAPYRLGASGLGSGSLDCGLLTKLALEEGGFVPASAGLTRLADYQYDDARAGRHGLVLRAAGEDAQPGDLVFFNCPTSQSYLGPVGGVTHVGFALGNTGGEPLVLDARSSGVGVHARMGCVKAFASVSPVP